MHMLKWVFASFLCLLLVACGDVDPREPKPAKKLHVPALMGLFKIDKDEYSLPYKRTVEVTLFEELSEEQLTGLAKSIKSVAQRETERTFIGYRLIGVSDGPYWATTHYNPDLVVKILEKF